MDYQTDSIGSIIREARKIRGFKTQTELAKKLKVESVYVCNIEKNRHVPSIELSAKIARVLDLDLKSFLFLVLRCRYPTLASVFSYEKDTSD